MNWLQQLQKQPVIAVIRSQNAATSIAMAQAVAQAGGMFIEITWNSDRPAHTVEHLRVTLPHCQIGVGTLLTEADLNSAWSAGAQFGFTPHTQPRLIQRAAELGMPLCPGALTPTEILTAWQAGAPAVKVFPIHSLGGLDYLQRLQGPLGHIPLIPTGGVTLQNAPTYLQTGAIAVGVSSDLFPAASVQAEDWATTTARMQALLQHIQPNENREIAANA